MTMIHDDPEFAELVRVVATAHTLSLAAVESDYWLTHELWSLQSRGLPIRLTGVTSLSKGFGLLDRVSEDLEFRVELGASSTAPSVERSPSSFVHDALAERGMLADYVDNRPRNVLCLHPLVILLEKLSELRSALADPRVAPAKFVRHFEDAAQIIRAQDELPPLARPGDVRGLVEDMRAKDPRTTLSCADALAFTPDSGARWTEIRTAFRALAPMYWRPRRKLAVACAEIRTWLLATL